MELAELARYADEKYQIREERKWADFPGFSVLCHPQSGKWIALLMRQWDGESGREIERCDLKCGRDSLIRLARPYLGAPSRMSGARWIGVCFDARTEPEIVYRLFDRAVADGRPQGCLIELDTPPSGRFAVGDDPRREITVTGGQTVCTDTPLPFAASGYRPPRENMPERLRELRRMFRYGWRSEAERAKSFFEQAVFMADYEDDCPWKGDFVCYFPSYQDLSTAQLRGYFTWRAKLRRGVYEPIPASAAYLCVYELLNGVGADSPEDALDKLLAFEKGFVDSGVGDARMRTNLRRWMLEFAVLHELPPARARAAADPELIRRDEALAALKNPEQHSDDEVFAALCAIGGRRTANSPVISAGAERGKRLFADCWRAASAYVWAGEELFTLCFGEAVTRRWYPLAGAPVYARARPRERSYTLGPCRRYVCAGGVWQETAYDVHRFDRARVQGFVHEADARLRRYLKTGRALGERPADEWAVPYIEAVIDADRRSAAEAARPRITLDPSELARIRAEALVTCDSLLTDEEREAVTEPPAVPEPTGEADAAPTAILRALLRGEESAPILKARRLTPSLAADLINEALFDEIGDNVLLCEDGRLELVEDYREDIESLLEGKRYG